MIQLDFRLFEHEACWNIQALHALDQPTIAGGFPEISEACEWLWEHVDQFQQGDD